MSSLFVKAGTGSIGSGEMWARALVTGAVTGRGQPGASQVLPNYRLKLTARGRSAADARLRTRAAA